MSMRRYTYRALQGMAAGLCVASTVAFAQTKPTLASALLSVGSGDWFVVAAVALSFGLVSLLQRFKNAEAGQKYALFIAAHMSGALISGVILYLITQGTLDDPNRFAQTSVPVTKPVQVPKSIAMPAGKIYINTKTLPRAKLPFKDELRVGIACVGTQAACNAISRAPASSPNNSAFRVTCGPSHLSFDDPIVWPGQPGRTHLHLFFGNTTTNAKTDVGSMATSGRSTCHGGRLNRSGYWTPTFVYHRPGHVRDGEILLPTLNLVYYKAEGLNPSGGVVQTMVWPPEGLRMIGGNPAHTGEVPSGSGWFDCLRADNNTTRFTHIPSTAEATALGAGNCSAVIMVVRFGHCWDGFSQGILGKGHMTDEGSTGGCDVNGPFPVLIPQISYNMFFPVPLADLDYVVLSSDWPRSYGYPPGHSLHGDWVNGWSEVQDGAWMTGLTGGKSVTRLILDNCLKAGNTCYQDLLGNPVNANDWWWLR